MLKDDQETRQALMAAMLGPNGIDWSRVIAKANELAEQNADTLRVVRRPEVEVVGEMADPVEVHGADAWITYALEGCDQVYTMTARSVAEYKHRTVTRWCLASDLARDPATATWHERTVKRVRRWDAASVPPSESWVVLYTAMEPSRSRMTYSDAARIAERWNQQGNILAWHLCPTTTPDTERAK